MHELLACTTISTMTRSTKSLADAIGLPDEEDRIRIEMFLKKYEEDNPGEIQFHRDAARIRLSNKKHGVINEESGRRYLFELPQPIGIWLGQAYPLMFRDKRHLAWFCKNFKHLMIPEKY